MNNEVSMNDEGVMDSILKNAKSKDSHEVFESNLLKDVIYQLQRSNKINERILKNVQFFFWLTIAGMIAILLQVLSLI